MPIDCEAMGEMALLLRFGSGMDTAANARVHAAATAIGDARLPQVTNLVPAYASLMVCHRPLDKRAGWRLQQLLVELAERAPATAGADAKASVDIPVCYGGEHGPDLAAVARHSRLDAEAVIARHAQPTYRVAMTGFAPGFAYLLGLDTGLATPRRDTPRTRVPAGSVGIAGGQTGIYPGELPGGWQLIGRTPLMLFDANHAEHPCRLVPGDRVHFRAIDTKQFKAWQEASC